MAAAGPASISDPQPNIGVRAAVGMVVGTALLALVVVGAVVSASGHRLASGPPVAPPAPVAATAEVQWALESRKAAVGELSATLPGRPFTCGTQPRAMPPTLSSAITCSTIVHGDYTETSDWSAVSGIGVVTDDLVDQTSLLGTGHLVFNALRSYYFPHTKTTTKERKALPSNAAATGKSMIITGNVGYSIKGLSSTYDRLVVVVFQLADGTHAAWFVVRPNDTPQAILDVLNAAADTVTVRH